MDARGTVCVRPTPRTHRPPVSPIGDQARTADAATGVRGGATALRALVPSARSRAPLFFSPPATAAAQFAHPPPSPSLLSPSTNPPVFHAVIEVPRGSKVKYRLDPATGLIAVANVLGTSVVYPHNYGAFGWEGDEAGAMWAMLLLMREWREAGGRHVSSVGTDETQRLVFTHPPHPSPGFVPQTMDEDGDALDVLVIMSESVHPFSFLRAKPIGVVRMTENNRPDSKIIAVHADDPSYRDFNNVHELPAHRLTEISRFLEDYRTFEGRLSGPPCSTPKVSVDGFEDVLSAKLLLKEAQQAYKASYLPKRPRTE